MRASAIVFLEVDDVELAHSRALATSGGLDGTRDQRLLASAVGRVQTGYYSSLAEMAAAYSYGISRNHAFVDGNKRAGFLAMDVFLRINGVTLKWNVDAWERIMLDVAEGAITQATLTTLVSIEMVDPIAIEEDR